MSKNIIMPGDQYAEKGTTPWADWQRSRMKHALKDVNFEARQIVAVIRDMCSGLHPAWHLMTREDGVGFRTFEEFVTSPDGLTYPSYEKFKGMALSDPDAMKEREYDLLTAAPALKPDNYSPQGSAPVALSLRANRSIIRLRAINRAPVFIRKLYVANLIDAKLAEQLGPDERAPGYPERKAKADRALAAIRAIARNGSDDAYRKAVNDAVRQAFGKEQAAGPFEKVKRLLPKLTAKERRELLKLLTDDEE